MTSLFKKFGGLIAILAVIAVLVGSSSVDARISNSGGSSGSFLSAVVEDLSPVLGAALDAGGFAITNVATEAYDATGWNGDTSVPTKDDVRDKFESLASGSTITNYVATSTGADVAVYGISMGAGDTLLYWGNAGYYTSSTAGNCNFVFSTRVQVWDSVSAATTTIQEVGWGNNPTSPVCQQFVQGYYIAPSSMTVNIALDGPGGINTQSLMVQKTSN